MLRRHTRTLAILAVGVAALAVIGWGIAALRASRPAPDGVPGPGTGDATCTTAPCAPARLVAVVGDVVALPVVDVATVSVLRLDGPTPSPPPRVPGGLDTTPLTPGSYEVVVVATDGTTTLFAIELLPASTPR